MERNLPPEPPRRASAIKIGTDDLLKSDDATPLGVNVQAIVLIGANAGAKQVGSVKGVDVSRGQRTSTPLHFASNSRHLSIGRSAAS